MTDHIIVEIDPDKSLNNLVTNTDRLTNRYLPSKKLPNKDHPWYMHLNQMKG